MSNSGQSYEYYAIWLHLLLFLDWASTILVGHFFVSAEISSNIMNLMEELRSRMPTSTLTVEKTSAIGAQRIINLEIPVLVWLIQSSNVVLSLCLDGRLFQVLSKYCCVPEGTYGGSLINPCERPGCGRCRGGSCKHRWISQAPKNIGDTR